MSALKFSSLTHILISAVMLFSLVGKSMADFNVPCEMMIADPSVMNSDMHNHHDMADMVMTENDMATSGMSSTHSTHTNSHTDCCDSSADCSPTMCASIVFIENTKIEIPTQLVTSPKLQLIGTDPIAVPSTLYRPPIFA
jgi:hypothetical protein